MVNINYGVSVTPSTISELPWYISNWHINTADLVVSDQGNHASELAYIKSLNLRPRIDAEMVFWAGGNIQDAISDYAGYFNVLKAAGWPYVCSEGGRPGDADYIKNNFGIGYINYNCDQCGLWKDLYQETGTALNLWEAYYPWEVPYIMTGAGSGKPNGVLAGAWGDSVPHSECYPKTYKTAPNKSFKGTNGILTNSLQGGTPSYKSIMTDLLNAGHSVTDFEVWGGIASSRSRNESLGFDTVVKNLQAVFPPVGSTPPPPPVTHITFVGDPFFAPDGSMYIRGSDKAIWRELNGVFTSLGGICTSDGVADNTNVFVRGSDNALWYRPIISGGQWKTLGGILSSAPALDGKGYVYVLGSDSSLYKRTMTTGWVRVYPNIK